MPFDIKNPPDKIRKLSDKKQRQWVSVFNSCWKKYKNDERCHKMAWGVVNKKQAALLNDFGITDKLFSFIKIPLQELRRATMREDIEEMRRLKKKYQGKKWAGTILSIAKKTSKEQKEQLKGYYYSMEIIDSSSAFWAKPVYVPSQKMISVIFNFNLPTLIKKDEYKKFILDIKRADLSIRHEVTHLVRDSQVHNIENFVKRMNEDKKVYEFYQSKGHQEIEFEIDAIINSLARLKRRMPKRYDALTKQKMEKIMPGLNFPQKGTFVWRKWIVRLTKEDLLPVAMQKQWSRAASNINLVKELIKIAKQFINETNI